MRVNLDIDRSLPHPWAQQAIAVRFSYSPEAVQAVKSIMGARFVNRDNSITGAPYWRVPLELSNCYQLRDLFGDQLTIGVELKAWAVREVQRAESLNSLRSASDASLARVPFADDLRPFQRAGVAFLASAPHGQLIADEPGLGKTWEAIGGVIESGLRDGVHLVVAPKTALRVVWERHLAKLQPNPIHVLIGNGDLATAMLDAQAGEPCWVVVNPAKLRSEKYKALLDVEWSTVTVDECHKEAIRNPKTQTAKVLSGLKLRDGGKRIAISGTPMRNRLMDLWGTLHWLNPDVFTGKWKWAYAWAEVSDNGYGKVIGGLREGLEDKFEEHLAPYVLRRTKAEVLPELPPINHIDLWLDMEGQQAIQHDQMAEEAEVTIEEEKLSAVNVLSLYTRLKQFASAYCTFDENGQVVPTANSNKLDQVMRLLEERGILDGEGDEKVVIFSQFSKMVDMVHRELVGRQMNTMKLTGATTRKGERDAIQDSFQSDEPGSPRVLVMTTSAGGVAITLDRADTVVFLDEMWTPDEQSQAADRVHRISRIHNVTAYYLRSRNSIEQYIMDIVLEKSSIHKAILDGQRPRLKGDDK